MEVVFGLIGVSVVLLAVIAAVLLWAVRSGQFEDLEGPAWRVVLDDDRTRAPDETGEAPVADRPDGARPGEDPPRARQAAGRVD